MSNITEVRLLARTLAIVLLFNLCAVAQEKEGTRTPPSAADAEKEVQLLLGQVRKLAEERKYDAAMPLAEKAVGDAERRLPADDLNLADALATLAYLYVQKGHHEKAEPLYLRAIAIGEKGLGTDHFAIIVMQGYLADSYVANRSYDKAEEVYKRALASAEKKTEPEAKEVVASLSQGLADAYFHKNEYDKAETLYKRALPVWEKIHGTEHSVIVVVLHRLARIYNERDKYIEAELFAQRALAVEEKLPEPERQNYDRLLSLLAEIYIKKEDYDRADTFLQSALQAIEKEFARNPASVPLTAILGHFADRYKKAGQYDRAESLYHRAIAAIKKSGTPDYLDLNLYIVSLAELHTAKRDFLKAEQAYKEALKNAEQAVGPEHKNSIYYLDKLARLYDQQNDYKRSEALYRRALLTREKTLGPEHEDVAYTLSALAWTHSMRGEYGVAEPLFRRALMIFEKNVGLESVHLVTHLNSLAYVHYAKKEYEQAEPLYRRALAILEKEFGKEHTKLVHTLTSLANLYESKSDYEKAEPLYQRALAIQEKALGAKHPDLARTLSSLAWMYDRQGEYGKVEPLLQRALTIREEALGAEHVDVTHSLASLAGMYGDRGDHRRAENLYRRVLAIREKTLGVDHPDVADTLDSLAWLYFEQQDYLQAEQLAKRALKIIENKLGSEHPALSSVLNQLALVYKGQGDLDKAEPLYQRALKIAEKAYGANSSAIAQSLHNLALLYIAKGNYGRAEPLMLRSIEIKEKSLEPTHFGIAEDLTSLAYLYAAKGDSAQAIVTLTRGTEISEQHIANFLTSAAGTEEQKRDFMAMQPIFRETHGAVSLHIQLAPTDAQAARLALTTLLRRKGRVLDAVSDSLRVLYKNSSPEARALLQQLADTRAKLAALVLKGAGKENGVKHQDEATRIETEAHRLEIAVSARSAEFKREFRPVTLESVQKALPPGSALVEIVTYKPFNLRYKKDSGMWGAWHYAAYVLSHEGAPLWVDLGEGGVIDAGIAKLRMALSDPRRADVKELARALDERVMRPVRKLLGEARQVFISPDGALNLVPFGALVDERGRYLVETYSLTYLTSGRDLLRLQASAESKQSPIIVANPLFDSQKMSDGSRSAREGEAKGGRRSMDFSQMRFGPLPGTAGEAEAVGEMLSGARVLTQARATEAALKRVASPHVLHVATHGFFLPDQRREAVGGARGLGLSSGEGASVTASRFENPLLRSGLALAGANQRLSEGGEDGVLTALEVAGLNLWGTKLVVLSACETGVGEVKNSDGVYGLRRALVLAGAEAQVMSLWRVSDDATRDLMVAYYKRLQAGEGRTEALRSVQLEMLNSDARAQKDAGRGLTGFGSKSRVGDRSHPFYWASFIHSGAWQSMDVSGAIRK
jgi:CHAT domain-containing protein